MDIVDVDFRYVMRADQALSDQMANPPMIKVLQWRKKVMRSVGSSYEHEAWTDWQDVRTEEE